jgi:uncharacterized protein (UPF0335 family)|tara:strand:- start:281 stop:649 length:369 start_codon:yes stop_codon:yes gene_type:complete
MKLTTEQIKQLIKEELQKLLLEGFKGLPFEDGGIIIYFEDEESDEPYEDIEKGKEIMKNYKGRGIDQTVPLSSSDPDWKKITKEFTAKGYDFKIIAGDFKVKVPGGNDYVDYVLRYGRKQKK